MNAKNILVLFCFIAVITASAQNITDIAVMNDKSADTFVNGDKSVSTVDESIFMHPDRIRFDNKCIQIEGRDVFVLSGAFHYFRVPKPLWHNRMEKLKSCGFNCVETYVPWNWHERRMPNSPKDESCLDMTDLEDFLNMAEEVGLYVILRPGPYICAEWSGGGFPQWIMHKKPAKTTFDTWLQSNDSEFLRWNEHWYKSVCKTVAPHQISNRPKGKTGVIFFQVENEFNRVKWFPSEAKRDYLVQLIRIARKYGIEVPVITCWTDESRNVDSGELNGVIDMINSYPKWNVENNLGRQVNLQLKTQPGKPLISGELQGGWLSEVGGKLSWQQDGLSPAQTQNLTLYAMQRGFCGINYYMAVGGTNLDDWGARQMTATYDYAAAIGEDGSTNERYHRIERLADMLKIHGTKIARSMEIPVEYKSTDPDVKLALRQSANGDRYYFIRTEEHTRLHFGTLQTKDLTLDFALEPFGSMVYYLPAGKEKGEWWPKQLAESEPRPFAVADTIKLEPEIIMQDALPMKWKKMKRGDHIDNYGLYERHFVYYRTAAPQGQIIEIGRIGSKLINGTDADGVLVMVDGKLVPAIKEDANNAYFRLPGDSTSSKKCKIIILFESIGLHHHTNKMVEDYWGIGLNYVRCNGNNLPLEFAYTENNIGLTLSKGEAMPKQKATTSTNELLTWHIYTFNMPKQSNGVSFPYHLNLNHTGNGFIYLNGHCIGRCWQKGPQNEYYLPECWLNKGGKNFIAISLRPVNTTASVSSAAVIPITMAAETVSQ